MFWHAPEFQIVPHHVRRGLTRIYVVVSPLWIAWFSYKILAVVAVRHYWYWKDISNAVGWLLIVPIGGPILFAGIVWVISGFHEPPSKADYKILIARAVSELADNNVGARQRLYDRALAALTTLLQQQNPSPSAARIANERRAVAKAIRSIEEDERAKEKREIAKSVRTNDEYERVKKRKKGQELKRGSTILLVISIIYFPALWAIDLTSMSLYWVARPQK